MRWLLDGGKCSKCIFDCTRFVLLHKFITGKYNIKYDDFGKITYKELYMSLILFIYIYEWLILKVII